MQKIKKCSKCGRPKIKMNIEINLCDCPIDEASEKILKRILEINEEKKRRMKR